MTRAADRCDKPNAKLESSFASESSEPGGPFSRTHTHIPVQRLDVRMLLLSHYKRQTKLQQLPTFQERFLF